MTPRTFGGLIALTVFVADQAGKIAVLMRATGEAAQNSAVLGPFLDLALRWNRGISFSLFAQDSAAGRIFLLGLTLAAIALLGWFPTLRRRRMRTPPYDLLRSGRDATASMRGSSSTISSFTGSGLPQSRLREIRKFPRLHLFIAT